ncbi:hypothetical protein ACP4OV_028766 [Aristida adscensionis]
MMETNLGSDDPHELYGEKLSTQSNIERWLAPFHLS